VTREREKITYQALLDSLPDGVFVVLPETPSTAWLVWKGELLEWRPEGYGKKLAKPGNVNVTLLTPPSTVNTIMAGYTPAVALTF